MPSYALVVRLEDLGSVVAAAFDRLPTLPGVLVINEQGDLVTVISRNSFLQRLSQPYGIEIFLKRPLASFLAVTPGRSLLQFPSHAPIYQVVEQALNRPETDAYEPILAVGHDLVQVRTFTRHSSPSGSLYGSHGWEFEALEHQLSPWGLLEFRTVLLAQTQALAQQTEQLRRANKKVRTTQQQLIAQEKMASLGSLTAGIAHEIRNPLNFINNFSHLSMEVLGELQQLLQSIPIPPEMASEVQEITADLVANLKKIKHHGHRSDQIIQGMLLHAKGGDRRWESIHLNTLVASAINLAYHGMRAKDDRFNLTLTKSLDPNLGYVDMVPQDLDRVFINLLNNSYGAIYQKWQNQPPGSSPPYCPEVSVTTEKVGDKARVIFWDNGSGIPHGLMQKIFDPFFTTKPTGEGTGLGLFLSYEIITQQHQGSLIVESEPGEYCQFTLEIPCQQSLALPGEPTHES